MCALILIRGGYAHSKNLVLNLIYFINYCHYRHVAVKFYDIIGALIIFDNSWQVQKYKKILNLLLQ